MKGEIKITFDWSPERMELNVSAGMQSQEQKNFSTTVLLEAIKVIMNYKHDPLIVPQAAGVLPLRGANGLKIA